MCTFHDAIRRGNPCGCPGFDRHAAVPQPHTGATGGRDKRAGTRPAPTAVMGLDTALAPGEVYAMCMLYDATRRGNPCGCPGFDRRAAVPQPHTGATGARDKRAGTRPAPTAVMGLNTAMLPGQQDAMCTLHDAIRRGNPCGCPGFDRHAAVPQPHTGATGGRDKRAGTRPAPTAVMGLNTALAPGQ